MTDVLLGTVVILLLAVSGWLAVLTHLVLGLRPPTQLPTPVDATTRPDLPVLGNQPPPPEPYEPSVLGRHAARPVPYPRTSPPVIPEGTQ